MKCSKCGAEFEAKFCPECGAPANGQPTVPEAQPVQPTYQNPVAPQKKKHKGFKGVLIAVGVVIAISIIANIAGGGNGDKKASTKVASSNQTANSAQPNNSSAAPSKDEDKSFGIGEDATANDISMKLVSVTENKGSEYNKPADGKVFLLCEFNIENNSNKDLAISSVVSFEAYVDGYSVNQSISGLLEKGDKTQLDGDVAAGKKMNGIIAYEVPKDWKELEIQLNPDAFSFFSGKTVFKATKK